MRTKAIAATLLVAGFAVPGEARADGPQSTTSQSEQAREPWWKEFNDVCSKTEDSMSLSERELEDLIRRCDALLPRIQELEETKKKVYTERLRVCRGVYAYVLDAKRNEKK